MDFFLILVLGVTVLWLKRAWKKQTLAQDDKIQALTRRIYLLESDVLRLQGRDLVFSPAPQPISSPPVLEASPAPEIHVVPDIPPVSEPKPPIQEPSPVEVPPPLPTASLPGPKPSRHFDIEETLGANWLNKLGVAILVIGIALFLAYKLQEVGPLGKVITGFAVSLALLAGGIFLDRKETYRVFGRAGIGGGWALAFFTSYAMYHVEATRILASQLPDLILLLAVASGMVLHTLRFQSPVVTGLAFLLAFATLPISQVTVYSLLAEVILVAALVVIIGRRHWFTLEIFGIIAAYLSHWWWLRGIIEPMHGRKYVFPEFVASAAILIFYWALFRVSYIFRRCEVSEEQISTAAALLNSLGLLLVLRYQSVHPEWAFWALLILGMVELTLAGLPVTRHRRPAFLILGSIGLSLLFAAFPFRFTQGNLDIIWIVESCTFMAAGLVVREVLYRRMALACLIATSIHTVFWPLGSFKPDLIRALIFLLAALAWFAHAHLLPRRWSEFFEHTFDRAASEWSSLAGTLFLALACWAAFPGMRTAPSWAVAGMMLSFAARRLSSSWLRYESHFLFGLALIAALVVNLPNDGSGRHGIERLLTVGLVAGSLYATSRWTTGDGTLNRRMVRFTPLIYRWFGTSLLLLLTYYTLSSVSVAPACVVLGLILLEIGLTLDLPDIRLQSYLAFVIAFSVIFFVNLIAEPTESWLGPRLVTVTPVVLGFYYLHLRTGSLDLIPEHRFRVTTIAAWLGALTLAALLRFELSPDWVAAAWACGATLLIALAAATKNIHYLHQSVFFCLLAALRASLHSLYERSYLPGPFWSGRAFTTSLAAALLFSGLPFAYRLRQEGDDQTGSPLLLRILKFFPRRPEQTFFFAPLALLVALLAVEMRSGMITVSWSALGVLVFLFALRVSERSFRLAGLGLLLLGVGKIGAIDVWKLGPSDRYITLIVMGSALLLVSFLYSRFRDAIRKYL